MPTTTLPRLAASAERCRRLALTHGAFATADGGIAARANGQTALQRTDRSAKRGVYGPTDKDAMTANSSSDLGFADARWPSGLPAFSRDIGAPLRAVGGLFVMSADAVRFLFRRPFQLREFIDQSWFIARVAIVPTLLVAIPFTVLVSFTLTSCCASWARPT